MGENGGDAEATGALDIHEVAVGALNQALLLVKATLGGGVGVEEIVFQLKKRREKKRKEEKRFNSKQSESKDREIEKEKIHIETRIPQHPSCSFERQKKGSFKGQEGFKE